MKHETACSAPETAELAATGARLIKINLRRSQEVGRGCITSVGARALGEVYIRGYFFSGLGVTGQVCNTHTRTEESGF